MEEGTTVIAEELVTPAIETQKPQPHVLEAEDDFKEMAEGDEDEAQASENEDDGTGEVEEAPPEMIEVERNGRKYQIPKELEAELLMQADYTRKTQEVAETRKAVEAERERATALFQSSQQYIEAKAFEYNLDSQLKQFQELNWSQLEQEDPVGAMSAWRQFQQLKEQRGQVAQYLHNEDSQRTAKAEQDIANRLQETREFAETKIPGWTPEVDAKIVSFATNELGFQVEQLKASINPAIYKTLHLAWLGSQTLQKQSAQPKPAPAAIKPLTTVSTKANPSARKSPEQMNEAEYAAWYKQRQAKR